MACCHRRASEACIGTAGMSASETTPVDAWLLLNQLSTVIEAVREMREAQIEWGPLRETAEGQDKMGWHERNVDRLLAALVPPDKVLSYWIRGASTVVHRIMDGYSERERELMQSLLESNQWIAKANYYLGPPVPAADGSRQEFQAVALERLRDLALLRQLA